MKRALITIAFFVGIQPAFAESSPPAADGPHAARPRDPYVTSTGETVDKPGQSQSGGTTPLDRKLKRDNDVIDQGICKGC